MSSADFDKVLWTSTTFWPFAHFAHKCIDNTKDWPDGILFPRLCGKTTKKIKKTFSFFGEFKRLSSRAFYFPCPPLYFHVNLFIFLLLSIVSSRRVIIPSRPYWPQRNHRSQAQFSFVLFFSSILFSLDSVTAAQRLCFTSSSTHTSNCHCLSFSLNH